VENNLKDLENDKGQDIDTKKLLEVLPGLETYKTPKHDELIHFMKDIYPFKNRVFNCYLLLAGLVILMMTAASQY
jgi:hypothetical protein